MQKTITQADFVPATGYPWAGEWQADVHHGLGEKNPPLTIWVEYAPGQDGGFGLPGSVVAGPLGTYHVACIDQHTLRIYRTEGDAVSYPDAKIHLRIGA